MLCIVYLNVQVGVAGDQGELLLWDRGPHSLLQDGVLQHDHPHLELVLPTDTFLTPLQRQLLHQSDVELLVVTELLQGGHEGDCEQQEEEDAQTTTS